MRDVDAMLCRRGWSASEQRYQSIRLMKMMITTGTASALPLGRVVGVTCEGADGMVEAEGRKQTSS